MSETQTDPNSQSQVSIAPADKTSRWTQADDIKLLDGLTQQRALGQHHDSVWTAEAWTAIAELLKGSELVSGGARKTLQQCKARWQRLKIEFRQVKQLRNQPAFSWDAQTHMVQGSQADWDAYIAEHKESQPWRKKSFPAYDMVRLLLEDETGKEEQSHRWSARNTYEQIIPLNPIGGALQAFNQPMLMVNGHTHMLPPNGESISQINGKRKNGEGKTGTGKRQRAQAAAASAPVIPTPAPTAPALNVPEPIPVLPMPLPMPAPSRLASAIQMAEQSGGLSEEDFVKVVQLFQRNHDAADAYLAIQSHRARSLYLRAEIDDFAARSRA